MEDVGIMHAVAIIIILYAFEPRGALASTGKG